MKIVFGIVPVECKRETKVTSGLTLILVVIDDAVSITVKGSAAILGSHFEADRGSLASLDVVSSRLIIQKRAQLLAYARKTPKH